ncbi:hypothetical protein SDC9_76814 [bioreactor metagenome]|uniref:Uncharacterized protein n=1 Tax=bioreactor metagenome TaxID=1076179 RepID=A0A644YP30_9ZZZZ
MEKYFEDTLLDLAELAHMGLEEVVSLNCYNSSKSSYELVHQRMFAEKRFEFFTSEIAKGLGLSKEIISLIHLLKEKMISYKIRNSENDNVQRRKREEIADIAYSILVQWSKLGDKLFPPEYKGLVEMKRLYNIPVKLINHRD